MILPDSGPQLLHPCQGIEVWNWTKPVHRHGYNGFGSCILGVGTPRRKRLFGPLSTTVPSMSTLNCPE
jgi:hypothetical protein